MGETALRIATALLTSRAAAVGLLGPLNDRDLFIVLLRSRVIASPLETLRR